MRKPSVARQAVNESNPKMKSIIFVAVALLAVAAAVPVEKEPPKILSYFFDQKPEGYIFKFETDDGTKREETGVVREALDEDNKLQKVVVVSGSYTFRNKDGELDTINYFADESGYHADGKSIPKVPARR